MRVPMVVEVRLGGRRWEFLLKIEMADLVASRMSQDV